MICPNCGENNSENFRFCGMCGTALEARRPEGTPLGATSSEAVHTASSGIVEPRRTVVSEKAPARGTAPPVTGPSFLGLNQPAATKRTDASGPDLDRLRDQTFSGLDSFFEPEEPKTGARRIFLLLVLLVALGGAGWWAYSNYLGAITGRSSQSEMSNPSTSETPAANSVAQPAASGTAAPSASSQPQASQPSPTPPAVQPSQASPAPAAPATESSQPAGTTNPPAPPQSVNPSPATGEGAGARTSTAAQPAAEAKPPRPQKTAPIEKKPTPAASAASASTDKGDAAFRRGVAYLYGRGVHENCGEAIKYLKAASAQQNGKARSTFGTMYATGHCVPRDLPTSYSWFAQALRVDPNNQILEKDLTAVWNQMTPPERQMATRMKEE